MRNKIVWAVLAWAAAPSAALATNGYFSHGYGIKAKGMAGVGIALPQDSLAAATNPAGMAFVGNRIDAGLDWFAPRRNAEIVGNAFGPNQSFDGNDTKNFFIPEFGYNRMLNPNLALGVAVYGNGGMNTDYGSNPYARFGSTGSAGVDLSQLFIAPTLAYKLNENHALGVSLNLAYQQFGAKGLSAFAPFSVAPGDLTDRGHDSSVGWGVRLGWTGQIAPNVTLGATWQSKTRMGKFDNYKGLFADGGSFDIPENYGIGIAVKATPQLTVAADVQQIKYGSVKSIANPLSNLLAGNALGSANGPGFGWRDMTVYKLGVSYEYSKALTLRAGVSTGRQPIPENQTFFNILAPGVVENHLTLGATWTTPSNGELSVGYMHAFKKTVNGSGSIPPGFPPGGFGGGEANLKMYENSLGIAYGWKM